MLHGLPRLFSGVHTSPRRMDAHDIRAGYRPQQHAANRGHRGPARGEALTTSGKLKPALVRA